jgi:molybdopterin molybdotransferase
LSHDHSTLLSVDEAQQRLLDQFETLPAESIALEAAAGRILAEDIYSSLDLPPFPNSSMDGFAVRVADVAGAQVDHPAVLPVVADIPAGRISRQTLGAGQAARIMTGAPLPVGAEAVIPVEDTDFNVREAGVEAPEQVQIYRAAGAGENVRPQGQDVQHGELVLPAQTWLRPQEIGFLAMLGAALVPVTRRPRVAIFSSGDELVPVGRSLQPGQIHDSNNYTLTALVKQNGGQVIDLGIVADDARAVEETLDRAVEQGVDLLLTSAGVSVGAFDFVRSVVEQRGELGFWRVNMRPGKPLVFGHYRQVPFIGLPGNPVSAFVGFQIFVRTAIAKLAGAQDRPRNIQQVRLLEAVHSDGRESYLRAVISRQDGELVARLTGHQGSGNLRSLVQANALLILPSGVKLLQAGEMANAWLLSDIRVEITA